ncbi:MAG: YeeE/YedE family protein [Alphaproteobacteria bacterium]|nr:MAG: YeeE/YedE family protein [Alphaproteobacteria bacterium]
MFVTFLSGIVLGIIFGFAFEKSKVFDASSIVSQMLFTRFTMLKVFLTAVLTSLIVLNLMNHFGWFVFNIKAFNLMTRLVGGGLLGIGIGLSGACPGTVFAQIGVGYKDALFTMAGCFVSAGLFYFYGQDCMNVFSAWDEGKIQLTSNILKFGFGAFIIAFLWMIEKYSPWRLEV